MKKNIQKWIALAMVGTTSLSLVACKPKTIQLKEVATAKNVILMIGDGMGPTQIEAGELYKGEKLTMQGFPYMTKVETRSANALVTDSAAAATALATGTRTNNGTVGRDKNGNDLTTIVDIASSLGKRTGVITTEEIYGATPMGFSAHSDSRDSKSELVQSAVASSNVNFFACNLLGEKYVNHFAEGGYETIEYAENISDATSEKVFGSYIIEPKAEEMWAKGAMVGFDRLVTEALEYLSQDEDGFFLMAEGAHIDHGGHQNNFTYMLEELISFDNAVKAVLEWAKDRDDTVVIVTADHETGGLTLHDGVTHEDMLLAYEGERIGYDWTTTSHTDTDVNFYVNGANINFAQYSFGTADRIKNTDVFEIMKALMK